MRFNSNAFILPTVALLSLITPVVNADEYDITITSPPAGATFHPLQSISVAWVINNPKDLEGQMGNIGLSITSENPSVSCTFRHVIRVESGDLVLSGQSNGDITLPNWVVGSAYLQFFTLNVLVPCRSRAATIPHTWSRRGIRGVLIIATVVVRRLDSGAKCSATVKQSHDRETFFVKDACSEHSSFKYLAPASNSNTDLMCWYGVSGYGRYGFHSRFDLCADVQGRRPDDQYTHSFVIYNAQFSQPEKCEHRHYRGRGQSATRARWSSYFWDVMASRVAGEREGVVVREAIALAVEIAGKSQIAVLTQKEAVNAAYEQSLSEGLRTERRLFHMTFATEDQREGMTAFAEKRKPNFTNS
ncbi:hypothetical protein BGY98DRAFT_933164 [Russula aff. rugulosa BPL654]|nr:hypothetical protein BGY98DRAFT_933164 [Russula aff. rugulosa BPL654]